MKQLLLPLLAVLAVGCSSVKPDARTNYVAPSAAKLGQHISSAQEGATRVASGVKAASEKAKTVKERLQVLKKAVENQPPVLSLAIQIEGDVDVLTSILLSAGNEIQSLQAQLDSAQTERGVLQGEVNKQTDLLNKANMERNAAITQSKIDRDNAHQFKAILMILAGAAVVVIMFGIFRLKAFVPPLLWITLGGTAAIGIFLFFWLGSG